MTKIVPHHHRYVVQLYVDDRGWCYKTSSRLKWRARLTARYWESLGVYPYRVIDTK